MTSQIILDHRRHLRWEEAKQKIKEIRKVLDAIEETIDRQEHEDDPDIDDDADRS